MVFGGLEWVRRLFLLEIVKGTPFLNEGGFFVTRSIQSISYPIHFCMLPNFQSAGVSLLKVDCVKINVHFPLQ